MKSVVAMVLAGGRNEGFGPLTQDRAKAALPYAGHYRLIDFALSCLSDSGIDRVGVIMQYLPGSLLDHVSSGAAWDYNGMQRRLKLMPPFVGVGDTDWYLGSADAVRRNWNFARRVDATDVLVCSGDHAYSIDFSAVVDFHRFTDADLTIVAKRIEPQKESPRFGRLKFESQSQRVTCFIEKPPEPFSDWVSTGIYLFKSSVLERALNHGALDLPRNLPKDVVEPVTAQGRAYAYPFGGPWEYLEDVGRYYESHRELLAEDASAKAFVWETRTNMLDRGLGARPPAVFGPESEVTRSIISVGCRVYGRVIDSVLSPGVVVAPGAEVRESILLHDVHVEGGAAICRTISDKDVVFGADCRVGLSEAPEGFDPALPPSARNLAIIGKGAQVSAGAHVPLGFQAPTGTLIEDERIVARPPGLAGEWAASRAQH